MTDILCPECGHTINAHDAVSDCRLCDDCRMSPLEIAQAAVKAEKSKLAGELIAIINGDTHDDPASINRDPVLPSEFGKDDYLLRLDNDGNEYSLNSAGAVVYREPPADIVDGVSNPEWWESIQEEPYK